MRSKAGTAEKYVGNKIKSQYLYCKGCDIFHFSLSQFCRYIFNSVDCDAWDLQNKGNQSAKSETHYVDMAKRSKRRPRKTWVQLCPMPLKLELIKEISTQRSGHYTRLYFLFLSFSLSGLFALIPEGVA